MIVPPTSAPPPASRLPAPAFTRVSRFGPAFLAAAAILSAASPSLAQDASSEARRLALVGHGRFAVFADLDTVAREGDTVRVRALQVGEAGFEVAGRAYWGGWSWWRFDCSAETADRLDFASLLEGGEEGPSTPENAPAFPAAPGGDAHELLQVACASPPLAADAGSVAEAVAMGRALLE